MDSIAVIILGCITFTLIAALLMIIVSSHVASLSRTFSSRLHTALTSTTQIRELLQRAAVVVQQTFTSHQVFFYIHQDGLHYISEGTKRHMRMSPADATRLDRFVQVYGNDRLICIDDLPKTDEIYRLLVSYKVATALPLIRSGKPIGYLFLGRKKKGTLSMHEKLMLEHVADDVAIVIQNVLSVHEVRELNATLQQRIDSATDELRSNNDQLRRLDEAKDEFLSLASHQLRTPLTSVKGYISMVLEGDAGKVSKMQKQLLSEAFTSSERMVHLINDFLNISRIQTGKFQIDRHDVDLRRVVKQEVEALQTTAGSRGLTLTTVLPDEPIKLSLDEGKIRQVIMNFIDNALYYSKPDTTITIVLESTHQNVKVEVRDHGIGVPINQQAQLFDKFFRAENAKRQRPDGTGVGLFLAKKVIDGHGGRILFSSREGEGSMFGFSLPKQLLAASDAHDANDNQNNHQDNQRNRTDNASQPTVQ